MIRRADRAWNLTAPGICRAWNLTSPGIWHRLESDTAWNLPRLEKRSPDSSGSTVQPDPSMTPEPNPHKGRFGLRRPWLAAANSLRGLRFAWHEEEAFRQEVVLAAVLALVALWLPVSGVERLLLIFPLVLLLLVEVLNTAIEATVDRISLDRHPLSGKAKDLGSAAVALCIVLTLLSWTVIVGPMIAF